MLWNHTFLTQTRRRRSSGFKIRRTVDSLIPREKRTERSNVSSLTLSTFSGVLIVRSFFSSPPYLLCWTPWPISRRYRGQESSIWRGMSKRVRNTRRVWPRDSPLSKYRRTVTTRCCTPHTMLPTKSAPYQLSDEPSPTPIGLEVLIFLNTRVCSDGPCIIRLLATAVGRIKTVRSTSSQTLLTGQVKTKN